jgi:hypothetical protein
LHGTGIANETNFDRTVGKLQLPVIRIVVGNARLHVTPEPDCSGAVELQLSARARAGRNIIARKQRRVHGRGYLLVAVAALDYGGTLNDANPGNAGPVVIGRLLGGCRKRTRKGHRDKSNPA